MQTINNGTLFFYVIIFIFFGSIQSCYQSNTLNVELQQDLRFRVAVDQQYLEFYRNLGAEAILDQMQEKNVDNASFMHFVLDLYGWPGYNMVGLQGSHDAWWLVQYNGDIELQKKAVKLLIDAYKKKNASAQDVAYLADLVLLNEGKRQWYGTQLEEVNGVLVPQPLRDSEKVDERRALMGMGSLQEYIQQCLYNPIKS